MKKTKYLVLSAAAILTVGCGGNKLPGITAETAIKITDAIDAHYEEDAETFEKDGTVAHRAFTITEDFSTNFESLFASSGSTKNSLKETNVVSFDLDKRIAMDKSTTSSSYESNGSSSSNSMTTAGYRVYAERKDYHLSEMGDFKAIYSTPEPMTVEEFDKDFIYKEYAEDYKLRYMDYLPVFTGVQNILTGNTNHYPQVNVWNRFFALEKAELPDALQYTPTLLYSVYSMSGEGCYSDTLNEQLTKATVNWREGSKVSASYAASDTDGKAGSLQGSYVVKLIVSGNTSSDVVSTVDTTVSFEFKDFYLSTLDIVANYEDIYYVGKDPNGEYEKGSYEQHIKIDHEKAAVTSIDVNDFEDLYE